MVGAGHFADIQLEAWAEVKGGAILGLYDVDTRRSNALGQKYGITVFNSWDQAIKEVQPDFIDVCTPPDSHYHYTRLGADLSLPVLCQKPLAPTYEEGVNIVQYCRERNVPLMVNENWRWQAWYREMKSMIKQGMLGTVYTAYFAMRPGDGWGEQPYPLQPYFKDMEKFLVFETGVHFVDTFRYLFGEIKSVCCSSESIKCCCVAIVQPPFHPPEGI
jgi:predicted dehydrogenase